MRGWFSLLGILLLTSLSLPAADRELRNAVKAGDTQAIIARILALPGEIGDPAVAEIVSAVAEIEGLPGSAMHPLDRHRVFSTAVRALSRSPSPSFHLALQHAVTRSNKWPSRAVALEAAIQMPAIDAISLCLEASTDPSPQVTAIAVGILGRSKSVLAIDPVLLAMKRWEIPGTRQKALNGGRKELSVGAEDRAWLHSFQQYRTWLRAHRGEVDPANVDPNRRRTNRTGLGLFGLDLTGKNIVFLLDVSGSMMASDPLSKEDLERLQRGTGVAGKETDLAREMMEKRRRIRRAKRELRTVIEGLGGDRTFNVVAFSTDVTPWKPSLVKITRESRASASTFVSAIQASGITVTDEALLFGLTDPRVDTIYLITDGAPTHIGMQGAELPPDSRELMSKILADTRARNYLRGVRIFTLGFEDAEEDFLKKLADENQGRYLRIR